jgi:hypothetical protein
LLTFTFGLTGFCNFLTATQLLVVVLICAARECIGAAGWERRVYVAADGRFLAFWEWAVVPSHVL